MADSTSVLGLNYVKVPTGTTAERPVSPAIGYIWYNTTIGYMEYFGASGWSAIAAPPVLSTATPTTFNGESGTLITINGSNFDASATAAFVLPNGNTLNAGISTRVSSSQITATIPRDVLASESPLDVRVTNGSGLTAILENVLNFGDVPVFNTASGSIGTIFDSGRSSLGQLSALTATDANGGSITSYVIQSGALPTGLALNSTTAALSGTANAVGSDTTFNFTVRATDNAGNTTDRAFSILVRAPVVQSFTSGSGTFSVPSGVSTARVLVIAGGGSGGTRNSGRGSGGTDGGAGAGAGGMIDHPAFPLTPGGSVSYSVGGGAGSNFGGQAPGSQGSPSTFGSLTAIGGGFGGCGPLSPNPGGPGGSGGGEGGGGGGTGGTGARGAGVQPSQPGASGTFGYGFPGGYCSVSGQPPYNGSSGGGAGGAGNDGNGGRVSPGGSGRVSNITGSNVTYAGGGGGGGTAAAGTPGGGGGPGGGGAGGTYGDGAAGGTNTGGGGGGGGGGPHPDGGGGAGGPGIIIVRY
jgi:hypothetical protein